MSDAADVLLGVALSFPAPGLMTELALLVIVEMVLATAVLVTALMFALVVFFVALTSLALKWCVSRGWRRQR